MDLPCYYVRIEYGLQSWSGVLTDSYARIEMLEIVETED
jgi:hypothetical protein